MERLRRRVAQGGMINGTPAGSGAAAGSAEAGGADLIAVYHSAKYETEVGDMLAGLLPYGDANRIVAELGGEVLPAVKETPVLAGVCGTDPFRVMDIYLKQLKGQGFSGVQNVPTVGLIDGVFRSNLEEAGLGYGLEVEMIRRAHKLELFTCPFVFGPDDARSMAAAGADCLVAHLGYATRGPIGSQERMTLGDCASRIREIAEAGRSVNPGILVLCHGDPVHGHDGARGLMERAEDLSGFFAKESKR
ncbi:phosphoenolpyruvate hydrolase family protein [Paenibacillus sp. IB182493]|uniref:Phosphoenolpyruvate hydrolase family protein n=2 Tax=Paenibacillus arenilitoris TaxID=2772299 RepID=A0A927CRI8_9BACL|nr:phosphoenolpyruvate hydrolase family protein [Paenibacillus arenilitoris]